MAIVEWVKIYSIKLRASVLGMAALYLCYLLIDQLEKTQRALPNYVTIVGTVASLYGLTLAYFQIASIKKMALLKRETEDETSKKVSHLLLLSDVIRSVDWLRQVQLNLDENGKSMALLRMKDIKDVIVRMQENVLLEQFILDDSFVRCISSFHDDLHAIEIYNMGLKKKLNFGTVSGNIESLCTVLLRCETFLKNYNHG